MAVQLLNHVFTTVANMMIRLDFVLLLVGTKAKSIREYHWIRENVKNIIGYEKDESSKYLIRLDLIILPNDYWVNGLSNVSGIMFSLLNQCNNNAYPNMDSWVVDIVTSNFVLLF